MKTAAALPLLLLLCLQVQVQAWVAISPFNPARNHASHCYGEVFNIGPLAKGETKYPSGSCVRATCGSDRSIRIAGCGSVSTSPPCYIVPGDKSKPYPECCVGIRCP